MPRQPTSSDLVWLRFEEAGREVGVLLVAFAPLDLAFSDTPARYSYAVLFVALGVLSFGGALWAETRRQRNG